MRYAILSDVHANLEALQAVLSDAQKLGAERVVYLGDVVGYGPLPAETIARVRQSAYLTLAGNHDDAVSGRGSAESFIGLAKDAITRHREALHSDDLAWLGALPYTGEIEGARLAHGDLVDPPKFYYVENEDDARANFTASDAQLIFVGHTHTPCLFLVGASGTIYKTEPLDFAAEGGKRYIVNPGSVGYPRERNGECTSSYVLYDTDTRSVTFRFLPFAVSSVMQRGENPRRLRKRIVAILILLTAVLAASAAFFLRPKPVVVTLPPSTSTRAEFASPRLVMKKSVNVRKGDTSVRANLLVKDPVLLEIVFKNANGEILDRTRDTVRKSSKSLHKLPIGTLSTDFLVFQNNTNTLPRIVSFEPEAVHAN